MKFIQIAVTSDVENGEILYALGDDGNLYEKTVAYYGPTKQYEGRSITRGNAHTEPFWVMVDYPFAEPQLSETQLQRLTFQEDK